MRDGAVGVGPFDVESEDWAVRGVAQLALQEGVGLHVGVACPELSASHLRLPSVRILLPGSSRGASYPIPVFEFLNVNELSMKRMAFEGNRRAPNS